MSDEEWEQEFKRPHRTHEDGKLDVDLKVHSMVQDASQEIDKLLHPLEEIMQEIVMNTFTIVDGLQDGANGDYGNEDDEEPLGNLGVEHNKDDAPT